MLVIKNQNRLILLNVKISFISHLDSKYPSFPDQKALQEMV